MKIPVLNIDGKTLSDYDIDLAVDSSRYNFEHIAYLVRKQQQAALRQGTHSTKTRGEVSGGGSKPYKQKGTGKARRGSNRTPLRVGGGISFGPKPRSYSISLNKKLVKLGYRLAVSSKVLDLVILDSDSLKTPNTKSFVKFVQDLKPTASKVLVIGSDVLSDGVVYKSARNLDNVTCVESTWVPLESLIVSDLVVFTSTAVKEVHVRFLS